MSAWYIIYKSLYNGIIFVITFRIFYVLGVIFFHILKAYAVKLFIVVNKRYVFFNDPGHSLKIGNALL